MTLSAMLVLGWLGLAPAQPDLAPPVPPTPSAVPGQPATMPVVPPPPSLTAPSPEAPTPTPTPAPDNATPAGTPTYTFTLGPKCETISPCFHCSAKAADGKAEFTAEDNQLKTVLTGAAGANVFFGAESAATLSVQVVQEFEISCSDSSISQVVLTLESNLAGFIRSKHKANACMRLASASIAPVGATTAALSTCFPTACVGGVQGCCVGPQGYKYETPAEPVKVGAMPLGKYVLQANFIIQATAGGVLDAHSTAIFTPESEDLDAWEREHDPFVGDAHDDFGFTLTLKADTPEGYPAVVHRKPVKARRISARNRAAQTR